MFAGRVTKKRGCSFKLKALLSGCPLPPMHRACPGVGIIVVVLQIIVIQCSRFICDAIGKDSVHCGQGTARLPWLPGALGSRESVRLSLEAADRQGCNDVLINYTLFCGLKSTII